MNGWMSLGFVEPIAIHEQRSNQPSPFLFAVLDGPSFINMIPERIVVNCSKSSCCVLPSGLFWDPGSLMVFDRLNSF